MKCVELLNSSPDLLTKLGPGIQLEQTKEDPADDKYDTLDAEADQCVYASTFYVHSPVSGKIGLVRAKGT